MNHYTTRKQITNQLIALALIVFFVTMVKINVGLPVAVIVGVSAIVGFFGWRATNLNHSIDPTKTATLFLLTVAALHVHMYEEHTQWFGPAMSRLFGIACPDDKFLLIFVFILPTIYYLTTIGLIRQVPLAGFIAWFIFIGPGIAEFTHFIFPLLKPALLPDDASTIAATVNGTAISSMVNHYIGTTGRYYFPGMYTAVLPMIPGICAVTWLLRQRKNRGGVPNLENTYAR